MLNHSNTQRLKSSFPPPWIQAITKAEYDSLGDGLSCALRAINRNNEVNNHGMSNAAGYTQGKAPLHPSAALIKSRRAQAGSGRHSVPARGEESLSARVQTASPQRQSELGGTPAARTAAALR